MKRNFSCLQNKTDPCNGKLPERSSILIPRRANQIFAEGRPQHSLSLVPFWMWFETNKLWACSVSHLYNRGCCNFMKGPDVIDDNQIEWEGAKRGQCRQRAVSKQVLKQQGPTSCFPRKNQESHTLRNCAGVTDQNNCSELGAPTDTPSNLRYSQAKFSLYTWHPRLPRKYRHWLWFFLYSYEVHIIHSGWRKCNGNWNIKKEDSGGLKGCPNDMFTSHSWTLWS